MRDIKYRIHKASGRAVIQYKPLWGPNPVYLPGPFNSPQSKAAFRRRTNEILLHQQSGAAKLKNCLAVKDLLAVYMLHANEYYPEASKHRGESHNIKRAIRPLRAKHGETSIFAFGPVALAEVRTEMIRLGWSRKSINGKVNKLRAIFRWAVSKELLPPENLAALKTLGPLRKGKTKARETVDVMPVDWEHVEAILPHVAPVVATMIRVHWLLGVRSDEITSMRPCETDARKGATVYVPKKHKTEWMGKLKFAVIGPRAQMLLEPYWNIPEEQHVFSPTIALREFSERRRAANKTKLYGKRKLRKLTPRVASDRYTSTTYHRAIIRGFIGILRARGITNPSGRRDWKPRGISWRKWLKQYGIEYWHPHQLRHSRSTLTREVYGKEGVEAQTGNTSKVVDIYALPSFPLAVQIATETG